MNQILALSLFLICAGEQDYRVEYDLAMTTYETTAEQVLDTASYRAGFLVRAKRQKHEVWRCSTPAPGQIPPECSDAEVYKWLWRIRASSTPSPYGSCFHVISQGSVARDLQNQELDCCSEVCIVGMGTFTVDDLGDWNGSEGLDVFMGQGANPCCRFGTRRLDVYHLGPTCTPTHTKTPTETPTPTV